MSVVWCVKYSHAALPNNTVKNSCIVDTNHPAAYHLLDQHALISISIYQSSLYGKPWIYSISTYWWHHWLCMFENVATTSHFITDLPSDVIIPGIFTILWNLFWVPSSGISWVFLYSYPFKMLRSRFNAAPKLIMLLSNANTALL